jgi:hypothetical protein
VKNAAIKMIEDAEHNYNLVKNSKPIHNIKYSDELLGASHQFVEEGLKKIGSTYTPPQLSRSSDVIPSQCANCHTGIETRKVYSFGQLFDHERHLVSAKIECKSCHSNIGKHGQLSITKENCMSCHHQKPNCESCHQLQSDLYYGKADYLGIDEPNIMAEAELDCTGCHSEGDEIVRPTPEKCVECHDEGYDAMEIEWKMNVKSSIENMELLLKDISPVGLSDDDKQVIENAQQVVRRLKTDGSWGVHNESAITDLLASLENQVKNIMKDSADQ